MIYTKIIKKSKLKQRLDMRENRIICLTVSLFFSICLSYGFADESISDFVNHGVMASSEKVVAIIACNDEKGNPLVLVAGRRGMYVIDANNGKTMFSPLPVESAGDIFHYLYSKNRKFYTVTKHADSKSSVFLEFDLKTRKWSVLASGPYRAAMSITEDSKGVIYAALYPNNILISWNPSSRKFINYGSLSKETWPQYPGRINVDKSGWIYVAVGNTLGNIVAFNPKTRELRSLFAQKDRYVPKGKTGRAYVHLGADGMVYGWLYNKGPWYRMYKGKVEKYNGKPSPRTLDYKWGWIGRIQGKFTDGSMIKEFNFTGRYIKIKDAKTGVLRKVVFDSSRIGIPIYSLTSTPDGMIYGSTGSPLLIFQYNPLDSSKSSKQYLPGGHANILTYFKGKIYGAVYADGSLIEYDPSMPWINKGNKYKAPGSNPHYLTKATPDIGRPHVLISQVGEKRIIMAGTPGYGITGGGMLIYDIATGEHKIISNDKLIANQSIYVLKAMPDNKLLGGTTITPGTGGAVKAVQAKVFLMDGKSMKIIYQTVAVPGAGEIRGIEIGDDGLAYGVARMGKPVMFQMIPGNAVLFVFNPKTGKVLHKEDISQYGALSGKQAPKTIFTGPDKNIYILFRRNIIRVKLGTLKHEKIGTSPVDIDEGVIIKGNRVYYASKDCLWSFKIKQNQPSE